MYARTAIRSVGRLVLFRARRPGREPQGFPRFAVEARPTFDSPFRRGRAPRPGGAPSSHVPQELRTQPAEAGPFRRRRPGGLVIARSAHLGARNVAHSATLLERPG